MPTVPIREPAWVLSLVLEYHPGMLLQSPSASINLEQVKRWLLISFVVLGLAGAAYWFLGRNEVASGRFSNLWKKSAPTEAAVGANSSAGRPDSVSWQTIQRPDEGFRVDLPNDPKDLEVPAYNEAGGSEPIKMIVASPDGEVTFAVTWQDNPPVARVNNRMPERTLEMARDGMLARTRTTLSLESRLVFKGYPARDISARNASGGLLNARLIYAGERLYTLLALFPSENARREQDVKHFFNSFLPAGPATIPATVPSAVPSGG